jgi:hypothetical protein
MAVYRVGSLGDAVRRIQTTLQQLGRYLGPIDGVYGGGTEAAVRAYQAGANLPVDGVVGDQTWQALFGAAAMPPVPAGTIDERCLALTGAFETSLPPPDCFAGISGDFDGMGLSFGALQWNLGQHSLQPILENFDAANAAVIDAIFGANAGEFRAVLSAPLQDQLEWARSIQASRFRIVEPWLGYFKTLGRTPAFIDAQRAAVAGVMQQAALLCAEFGLASQRARALMFDIMTQNGGIGDPVRQRIRQQFQSIPAGLAADDAEVARLRIVANCRADAANAQWREDVRRRKLTIAEGSGTVHGRFYDLAGTFGITLAAVA